MSIFKLLNLWPVFSKCRLVLQRVLFNIFIINVQFNLFISMLQKGYMLVLKNLC
jgi:hypothetical protein